MAKNPSESAGCASALRFAREGASVFAIDRQTDGLAATLAAAKAEGLEMTGGGRRRRRRDGGQGLCRPRRSRFGATDAFFANADVSGGMTSLVRAERRTLDGHARVNLIGPFLAIKHAAPGMVARGKGSIVLTASVAGLARQRGRPSLQRQQGGRDQPRANAANSLTGTGVRVNAICPGLIETGMTKPIFDARQRGDARARSASSTRCDARACPRKSPRWRCFWRATNRPMSTVRRSRSMAACRARILSRGQGSEP